jgi:hypothetical protein
MPEENTEQSAPTIDLLDERFAGELDVKLTKGQIVFLYNLVEQNVQARGFRMVQFAFGLMTKLEELNGKIVQEITEPNISVEKTVIEPPAPAKEASDDIFTAEESA